jgi:hypothetical protein
MRSCCITIPPKRSVMYKGAGLLLGCMVTFNLILSSPMKPSLFPNFTPPLIEDKVRRDVNMMSFHCFILYNLHFDDQHFKFR